MSPPYGSGGSERGYCIHGSPTVRCQRLTGRRVTLNLHGPISGLAAAPEMTYEALQVEVQPTSASALTARWVLTSLAAPAGVAAGINGRRANDC